jgi:1-phosphatidylinositol-4-phosphate 5-kinase
VARQQGTWARYLHHREESLSGYYTVYAGSFSQFVKQGYGVETFTNGDSYRGYYEAGRPHGHGEYHWASGATYTGEFRQGVREGEGRWCGESGDEYLGHYSADRKNGWG